MKVYLVCKPVDMRRGFDGLAADVAQTLRADPYSGAAFVFRSKRGDYVKILTWDGSGLCLFAKRLEKGLDRGAVFTGQYLSLCRISFNKSNGLASQLRTGKEPLLARCDNATQALRLDRDRETIQAKLTLNHPSESVR